MPGWSEYIQEYRDKAIFWHRLWKENGSPHTGVLFDIRRQTRWKYHHMLKIVKRNNDSISAHKMYQNLKGTGFWTEVQRIIGYNKTRVNTLDGVQGGDQIAEIFREKYDSLYNSVSYDDCQIATLQEEIELAVMTRAEQDRSYKFTISDIDS